jgi:hypothetical protein
MMLQECGQHQIDFVRRDSERVFKHGERMIEATSNLLANRPNRSHSSLIPPTTTEP